MSNFSNINAFAHDLVKKVIGLGDIVVDATAGNGYDTLFLAQEIGRDGKVFSFDIQRQAIENTYQLLQKHQLLERVVLIQDGHENLSKHIRSNVKAVMFNLGYLPKGDHGIITGPATTVRALEQSLEIIERGGLITAIVYTGHLGGQEEEQAVIDFISNLDKRHWDVLKWFYLNRGSTAPYLIAISRREGNNSEIKAP
ncbi:MAG: tRNA (mnm(5)s(2)U34)-methyltransferase [Bacillota bacterium]